MLILPSKIKSERERKRATERDAKEEKESKSTEDVAWKFDINDLLGGGKMGYGIWWMLVVHWEEGSFIVF